MFEGRVVVLGIDPSLTATGLSIAEAAHVMSPPKKMIGVERLDWYEDKVSKYCRAHHVDVALIEGYAHGAKFNREVLGELGCAVRLALFRLNIPFTVVAPKTVKKYATGKGNANKDEMLAAAIQRSGLNITNNNAADAWWLYQIGCTKYAPEFVKPVPKVNQSALETVDWPMIGDSNDPA